MRILILNQYAPSEPAPTGRLFGDLARDWDGMGHQCEFVSSGQVYRGGGRGFVRWLRELCGHLGILRAGLRTRKVDLVVAGSSPPCLLLLAAVLARWHGASLIHWAMDLYPELAARLGEKGAAALSALLRPLMRLGYAQCQAVVTLDEDMAAVVEGYGVRSQTIRPWYCGEVKCGGAGGGPGETSGKTGWSWVYSGNLGRAHEWGTLLDAQALLERRGVEAELVFQGGGAGWRDAQERAAQLGLKRCLWRPYLSEEELVPSLLGHDGLVASQVVQARGCLWPSKLALFLGLPLPVLWVGPVGGSVARLVGGMEGAGCYGVGDAGGVAAWVEGRMKAGRRVRPLWKLEEERLGRLADWRGVLEGVRRMAV